MDRALKELIVDILSDSSGATNSALQRISPRDWERILPWLDASGLALYLLDTLRKCGSTSAIPDQIILQLEKRLEQNRTRVADCAEQLHDIQEVLASRSIQFILLKGLSLVPEACDDPALRFQIDTDILIDTHFVQAAQHALASLDYELTACSGSTWEFKTPSAVVPLLQDLYKPKPQRSLELHFISSEQFDLLYEQAEWTERYQVYFHRLSPHQGFLNQATHLFKHMQSEWIRLAWLLEFRHSALYWRGNEKFWTSIEDECHGRPDAAAALGAAVALAQTIFPTERLPQTLLRIVSEMDRGMRLWIQHFGKRAAMAEFPGTKLYLLQPADHATNAQRRWRRLLPLRTPPTLITSRENAAPWTRLRAIRAQFSFFLFRMSFHLREGSRYLIEAPRWRRYLAQAKP